LSRSRRWRAGRWRENLDPARLPHGDFRLRIPRFHAPDRGFNLEQINAFRAFAAGHGLSAPALAMAWLLNRGPHAIPIPGTRTADHLSDRPEPPTLP